MPAQRHARKIVLQAVTDEKSIISITVKCSGIAPSLTATALATREEIVQGTSAEYCIVPTLTTSIENIAAAIGVPKSAEKAALIPDIINIFLSSVLSLNSLPKKLPMLPPI